MRKCSALLAVVFLAATAGSCFADGLFDQIMAPYSQRVEGIDDTSGNARNVNAAIHMHDPWPRRVRDRRIPVDGERMTGAVERYRDVRRLREAPPPLTPTLIPSSGLSGTSTGGTATPVMTGR